MGPPTSLSRLYSPPPKGVPWERIPADQTATKEAVAVAARREPSPMRTPCWGVAQGRAPGGIQSREGSREMISTLLFPSILPDGPPLSGLDYVHSKGARSHLITEKFWIDG